MPLRLFTILREISSKLNEPMERHGGTKNSSKENPTRHKDLMRRGEHFLPTLSIFGVMVEQTNKH